MKSSYVEIEAYQKIKVHTQVHTQSAGRNTTQFRSFQLITKRLKENE
jgi:hypothetical protein